MASKKNLAAAAQAVTDKFFTAGKEEQQEAANKAVNRPSEARKESGTGVTSSENKTAEKGQKTASKVFSFRAAEIEVDRWRLYASIKGEKVDAIGAAAMREYLKKHPLDAEEKALFDKRLESMKS